jgi:hypothetical protein
MVIDIQYVLAHLKIARVSSTIAIHLGTEKTIFIKIAPIARTPTPGTHKE